VPDQPVAPVTTWVPDNVEITWQAPDDGGSTITGYKVFIKQKDGGFSIDYNNCDMLLSSSVTCSVPASALVAEPFSLDWGDSVIAKVLAVNAYGDSLESAEGNGAVILTYPGAPLDILEVEADRSRSSLGISWTAPFAGGDTTLDYRVNIREQGGTFSVLASGITVTNYKAELLTAGVIYEFTVEAQNSYNYGAASAEIALLCAFIPEPPSTVSTSNVNDKVVFSWNEPVTNGSPITAFKIFIRTSDQATYVEETTICGDTVAARSCEIELGTLQASPYSLAGGDSVFARVVSVNVYGESPQSAEGNGAFIQLVPDPPINLANDVATTDDT